MDIKEWSSLICFEVKKKKCNFKYFFEKAVVKICYKKFYYGYIFEANFNGVQGAKKRVLHNSTKHLEESYF